MGCGASKSANVINGELSSLNSSSEPKQVWLQVCKTLDVPKGKKSPYTDLVIKRTGWKTVRIFVSSTFKDFHREREILVKEVFPDLRAWCENRRLHLLECDLRWGVPKDSTTELTLRTCLGEIDRCYQDNIMPFFINMTSERVGWIPEEGDVPQNVVDEYKWVFGLSVTEMEIVHGAYRKDNPNSIFLVRDDSFLNTIPEEHQSMFIDENPIAKEKLKVLKNMITDRFPTSRILNYKCEYDHFDEETGRLKLHVEDKFKLKVFDFFKDRISLQYPLIDESSADIYQHMYEGHESFMKAKADSVVGRANLLTQIMEYVNGDGPDVPLLLLGGAGTGKSSIMAKAVDDTLTAAFNNKIPGGGGKPWYVFNHFVGAVPGSTSLLTTLQRLLKEMKVFDDKTMPSDMETIVQKTCGVLNMTNNTPTIIFIDAINQFDKETAAELMTWIPRKLGPKIRCIFSMIHDTPPHKALTSREPQPKTIVAEPLSLETRKEIVRDYLGKFNKRLDDTQMDALLSKSSSVNPLWLSIACEELRVYGEFRKINDKINTLQDGLLSLLQQVLHRFEEEGGGHLLAACLSLLEVSATGLLEAELLRLLADEENLLPNSEKEKGSSENSEKSQYKNIEILPAYKWAAVYRSLRPFLRPFGDSGEGRLDFYHRALSKAVRQKYLKAESEEDSKPLYRWWHSKLAKFFVSVENLERKLEEYPYHLMQLKDTERLADFVADFSVFDKIYDPHYSPKLIKFWTAIGPQSIMETYSEKLQEISNRDELSQRLEQITRLLIQVAQFDAAKQTGAEALEIEEKELGARPERMGSLYNMMAQILADKLRTFKYVDAYQAPMEWEALTYFRKAAAVYKKLAYEGPDHENKIQHKVFYVRMLVKLGYACMSWAEVYNILDDSDKMYNFAGVLNDQQAKDEAFRAIDEAIQLLEEDLENKGMLPEAYMTKGCMFREHVNQFSMESKWYGKAYDKAMELYGQYHLISARISINMGISHEDDRQYQKAFGFFTRAHEIYLQIYGPEHPNTLKPLMTMYQYINERLVITYTGSLPPIPQWYLDENK